MNPIHFKTQPVEYKVIALRECPTPSEMQMCDTPEGAVAYWNAHVKSVPIFSEDAECCVVLLLNVRRRIKGHQFVSIGLLDQLLVGPREVFRTAIVAAASAIVIMHSHPSGVIPHPVLCRMAYDLPRISFSEPLCDAA